MRGGKNSEIETTCKGESTASSLIFYACIIECCYYAKKRYCTCQLCLGCAAENICKFLLLLLSLQFCFCWQIIGIMNHLYPIDYL